MQISRENVYEICKKCGLDPDKDYGQNFLLEQSIQERIVSLLDVQKNDSVLEIGPGLGSLSHYLCDYEAKIDLVDIDRRMINFLAIHYKDKSNVFLIENDIRKHDVSQYTKILGNLPYNITTETIIYLAKNAKKCKKIVLMCQAEAFNHFFDTTGKEYGPGSVLVHLLGEIKREFSVKPGSFYPAPKCTSVVFTITLFNDVDFEKSYKIYEFVKSLFLNRRKTIANNLSNLIKNSSSIREILKKANISEQLRPEQISVEKFAELYDIYTNL